MSDPKVQDEWTDYSLRVMSARASTMQRIETRRAFYAGAAAMMKLVNIAAEAPEREACQKMMMLDAELHRFKDDVREGRA